MKHITFALLVKIILNKNYSPNYDRNHFKVIWTLWILRDSNTVERERGIQIQFLFK